MIDKIPGVIGGLPSLPKLPEMGGIEGVKGKVSFSDTLKDAMNEMTGLQNDADNKIEGLVTGKVKVSTHDAMIALEKADVAFQLMTNIKSKIIQAYQEVMRTSV